MALTLRVALMVRTQQCLPARWSRWWVNWTFSRRRSNKAQSHARTHAARARAHVHMHPSTCARAHAYKHAYKHAHAFFFLCLHLPRLPVRTLPPPPPFFMGDAMQSQVALLEQRLSLSEDRNQRLESLLKAALTQAAPAAGA